MVLASTLVAGCSKVLKPYTLDWQFSVNVGRVRPMWPVYPERLTPAEQEVLGRRGKPDLMHVWWMPNGGLVDQSTILRMRRRAENPTKLDDKLGWIYLDSGEEVVFVDAGHTRVLPISDALRTVCELGDPQSVRRIPDQAGRVVDQWTYYNYGHVYRFVDGVKISENKDLQPQPHYQTK